MMSVPPVIVAIGNHLDQRTASQITEMEKKKDWAGMLGLAQAQLEREPTRMDWWFLQGYALARQGQHAQAAEAVADGGLHTQLRWNFDDMKQR